MTISTKVRAKPVPAPISVTTMAGDRVVLDLADWRDRAAEIFRELGLDAAAEVPLPDGSLSARIAEKMELRGFDAALFVPAAKERPPAANWLKSLEADERYRSPLFVSGVAPEHVASAPDPRPRGAYFILTSAQPLVADWSLGTTPKEARAIMTDADEVGLTLGEYLLLERLHARSIDMSMPGERLDERYGAMLLDAQLPDGRTLTVDNSIIGRMTFGALAPEDLHPRYGARSGVVIELK